MALKLKLTARRISQAAALVVIGVGSAALLGWQFQIDWLKTGILDGTATMKANTALCFVLLGVALLWARSRPNRLWFTIWVAIPAWIALLTLGEYAWGWELNIDQLLFADQVSLDTPHPGRMGINTAVSFLLSSLALELLIWRCSRLAQALALLTLLICLQALIGYGFGVQILYHLGDFTTSMALHTAFSFIMLSVSILALQPQQGLMQPLTAPLEGGRLARQILPITVLFPILLGWLLVQGYRFDYYVPGFGLSLQVALSVLVQTGLIWQSAKWLNRNDLKRQQTRADLRKSEERYRSLTQAIASIVWIADAEGRFVTEQSSWEAYTGQNFQVHQGWGWVEALHPDDRQQVRQLWRLSLSSQQIYQSEGRLWHQPTGEYRYFEAKGVPILESDGSIREWVGTVNDVHDRKQTEAELRENEARLNSFVEADLVGILYGDIYRQIFYANDEFLNIIGYSRDDLQSGKIDWVMLTPPEYLPLDELGISEAQSRGACTPYEKEYIRKDGSRVPVLIGYRLLEPNREHSVAFILNLSEQKQAEAALRENEARFRQDLELRVKERTMQLEAANRELESFSYSVSHDLRAPLRHIAGFVELLQKRLDPASLDATSQRYLTVIAETTRQAGTLIDDLLSFSRMGRSEMRSIRIDMNLLIQEVQRELEPDLIGREIIWQIEPLPSIQGDPSMLRLAVRNLLENSVKYTRQRPTAEISIGSFTQEQETVYFVKDNGIGFNMQYAHKLFGIFQRLHSDPNYEGTGIGLANVQRIVHRHGGRIWAEGKVNQGATFFIALPKIFD
ncbi:MAG: PAS domain S-box protein [Pegethrix bostrychoides GSE-TBD4-15B]|uniref:histidine kinase n=1 Tax=Pegethrix bostrychoides GSE-TBD4-15B TaxID=2839662 RepID=A0A951PF08_9CYAN|nr:PAS domain S-box protein [Pegethrix bostrychoides GSE-TBD4-15B]